MYKSPSAGRLGLVYVDCVYLAVVPSSSSEDESTEKLLSETTTLLKTVEPLDIKEKRRFSETIAIEHKERMHQHQMQFALPPAPQPRKLSKSEIIVQQPAVPQGVKREVQLPGIFTQQKLVDLKRRAEATATERQTLQMNVAKQRRYSETLAIDQTKRAPVQLTFELPKHIQQKASSVLTVKQKAAPQG